MFLLKRDVKINARDETHQTPLHSAQVGLRGHTDVTEILLAQKADVTAQDHQGNTPLHKAILNLLGTDGHPLLNGKLSCNCSKIIVTNEQSHALLSTIDAVPHQTPVFGSNAES